MALSGFLGLTKGFIGLIQREFLDHAVDILQLGELDRLLRVECMSTGPSVNRQTLADLWQESVRDLGGINRDEKREKTHQRKRVKRNLTRDWKL